MKSDKIYKALKPKWGLLVFQAIVLVLFFLLVTGIVSSIIIGAFKESNYKLTGTMSLFYIIWCLIVFCIGKWLLNKRTAYINGQALLSSMDSSLLERLEDQVALTEPYFETIYLLEEYIFIPDAGLLTRYGEIYSYTSQFCYRNRRPCAVYLFIRLKDGLQYRSSVKNWAGYMTEYDAFMDVLEEKGITNREKSFNYTTTSHS